MKIIIYGMTEAKYLAIKENYHQEIVVVNSEYLAYKIEDLLKVDTLKFQDSKTYVIYDGFSQEQVMEFIKLLKNLDIKVISAMTTPTNLNWTLQALVSELDQENLWFTNYETLQNKLKAINDLKDIIDDEKNIILNAYLTYMNQEKDVNKLLICIDDLDVLLNKRKG